MRTPVRVGCRGSAAGLEEVQAVAGSRQTLAQVGGAWRGGGWRQRRPLAPAMATTLSVAARAVPAASRRFAFGSADRLFAFRALGQQSRQAALAVVGDVGVAVVGCLVGSAGTAGTSFAASAGSEVLPPASRRAAFVLFAVVGEVGGVGVAVDVGVGGFASTVTGLAGLEDGRDEDSGRRPDSTPTPRLSAEVFGGDEVALVDTPSAPVAVIAEYCRVGAGTGASIGGFVGSARFRLGAGFDVIGFGVAAVGLVVRSCWELEGSTEGAG